MSSAGCRRGDLAAQNMALMEAGPARRDPAAASAVPGPMPTAASAKQGRAPTHQPPRHESHGARQAARMCRARR